MSSDSNHPSNPSQREELNRLIDKTMVEHQRRLKELKEQAENLNAAIASLQSLQRLSNPPPPDAE